MSRMVRKVKPTKKKTVAILSRGHDTPDLMKPMAGKSMLL